MVRVIKGPAIIPARRASAGAVPGRRGPCSAASPHRPLFVTSLVHRPGRLACARACFFMTAAPLQWKGLGREGRWGFLAGPAERFGHAQEEYGRGGPNLPAEDLFCLCRPTAGQCPVGFPVCRGNTNG